MESFEVRQVLSLLLVGEFNSKLSFSPLLFESKLVYVIDQFLSLLSSVDGKNSELGELNSLGWDELSLNVSSWTVNQDLSLVSLQLFVDNPQCHPQTQLQKLDPSPSWPNSASTKLSGSRVSAVTAFRIHGEDRVYWDCEISVRESEYCLNGLQSSR